MHEFSKKTALVLFSGGQDSTICLAWALKNFAHVETIGFDYGQRHRIELECRPRILAALREKFPQWKNRISDDHMVDMHNLATISDTALIQEREITFQNNGLPTTFVPGRNLLFFTYAAAVAYRRGITDMVGGMCETDYSGYPDCRDDTLKCLQTALSLGMDQHYHIHTPLMFIDKASTWKLANELGGKPFVDLIREETHTCYMGERETPHEWGYGCGECPACKLRAAGYEKFMRQKL